MVVQWYYGRGSDISGPVSGSKLASLAGSGEILQTDTVWKEGVEEGVQAGRIKNLFKAHAPVQVQEPGSAAEVATLEENVTLPEKPAYTPMAMPANRGRASAGKGVTIVGQDGKNVKFRMKCTTCGLEDSSWKSIAIPRGTARASFFCRKCRKKRDVEIHGIL